MREGLRHTHGYFDFCGQPAPEALLVHAFQRVPGHEQRGVHDAVDGAESPLDIGARPFQRQRVGRIGRNVMRCRPEFGQPVDLFFDDFVAVA